MAGISCASTLLHGGGRTATSCATMPVAVAALSTFVGTSAYDETYFVQLNTSR